ncbi:MAG TPA: outer membrane protein assembly factor BamA [Accumulibacter sp.]|uniref:outer membrane protein assembly factor BamA n=1 Tax=Accumulibacter sp. TaxID=2053492 RepID=UPI0028788794|nr:outer membrane protein assembly factor BamA [Accumulibacter sp.]MDS4053435.1 outer membrane protein assembly factor BamA [Accumulibacter sp.]HMV04894.1 outer membrane protein assembly factor BamA [Accumulibacter sp.]HMW62693.1 outer membrane protein assembly factor BamA [Accumulibacter sp.]HMW79474.1 outer membrane protein assembly factor BamA [Accumulibacter sp.]HMX68319.1 outer membrane protein assembly factor BamA [Accumulibacter sp.]
MKIYLPAGLLALACAHAAAMEPFTVKDIRVEGIQRVEAGTVFSYLPVKVGETMNDEKAAQAIRTLFATGFFKDVRVEHDGQVLIIVVEERPAIAQIDFVGLKEFDKDQLIKGLKEVGIGLSRTFDRATLEKAEQELKRQYLSRGRYAVVITTTVTPLDRNRVAINFNIDEGEAALIKQINIVGAQALKEKDLLGVFQLRTPNWISWYTKSDQYSKQKLSADLESLRSYYLDRGYLEFSVDSTQVSISPDKKDIYITVSINEGERYVVSSVKLAGDLILSDDEYRQSVTIKAGDVFSREKLNASTKAIADKLGAQGYAFANVNASPELDKDKRTAAFTIFVDPGKRAYVRRVNITGNTKTRDEVIRQEIRQMEGGWYDAERVAASRERIDRTGYFAEVNVETPPVAGTIDQVDVNVNVAEKTTGNISIGAGYSSAEKLVLSGSISQANIFGSGRFLSLQVNTGKLNRTVGINYTNPYFTVDGISQGFDLYHRNLNPTSLGYAFKSQSTGGGIRFGFPISEKDTLSFGLAVDQTVIDIDPITTATPQQYIDFQKEHGNSNITLPLTVSWTSDSRNSAIYPTSGAVHRAGVEFAIPGVDLSFYRLTYQHQRYFPLTKDIVLFLNGEIGYAKGLSGQNLPFYKNFYAGGVGSVRGYDTASLGPYNLNDPDTRLGGTRKAVFNAELLFPLPGFDKSFRFGPFFDAGNVFTDKYTLADEGLRMSVGLTAAWLSPLGPLKFSLGQAINEKSNDKLQKFQFQLGTTF